MNPEEIFITCHSDVLQAAWYRAYLSPALSLHSGHIHSYRDHAYGQSGWHEGNTMQVEGKKGVLNLAVINTVFVASLTASMVGSTAFCMYWYGTTYVAIFSTIIKHAPTTYLWELCSHAVMPFWYLGVFGNYLDICRVRVPTERKGGIQVKLTSKDTNTRLS